MPDKDLEEVKETEEPKESVTEDDINKLFESNTHTPESDELFLKSLME